MKRVAIIPLLIGLAMGGYAIKIGLNLINEAKASGARDMVMVAVAATNIAATSEIEPAMLQLIETPVTPLTGTDSFAKLDEVIGRVAAGDIPRGAVVRQSLLAPPGTPAGLSVKIGPGFRAVSVRISEVTGVAYQLRPGLFVDVLAVMDVYSGRKKETVSRIILQQVEVAAVGRTINSPGSSDGKGKAAKSVTLLVKDSDVTKLHLAQTRGKITLALRGADDGRVDESKIATESELLGTAAAPVTAIASDFGRRADGPQHQVTVLNGGAQSRTVAFDGPHSLRAVHAGATAPRSARRPASKTSASGKRPPAPKPPRKSEENDNEDPEPVPG